jgi:hypothetical protein
MTKLFLAGVVAAMMLLTGCGSPGGLPAVFNTGGQVLLEGYDGTQWGQVVGTSNQALLRVTVGARQETTNVIVRLAETPDGRIRASVTGDGVAPVTGVVLIAADRWLLWPQLQVLDNIQAWGKSDYIDVSKDGAEFRLGTIEAGRQQLLTLRLPVSVYE